MVQHSGNRYIEIIHSNSFNCCQIAKNICIPASSWWKTTSSLFASSNLFFQWLDVILLAANSRGLFCWAAVIHSARFLCSPTKCIELPFLRSAWALPQTLRHTYLFNCTLFSYVIHFPLRVISYFENGLTSSLVKYRRLRCDSLHSNTKFLPIV